MSLLNLYFMKRSTSWF